MPAERSAVRERRAVMAVCAVAYLASPDAGFITGISSNVEGGFAA